MSADPRPPLADGQDREIAAYRALNGLAVGGLILGLLSPCWLIDPLIWILPVPALGALASALALRQISRNAPEMIGRKAALLGLILSILFGAAAPANWLGYRWAIRREARLFARQWFDLLAQDQAHKAYQLTRHPLDRRPLDDDTLNDLYNQDPQEREALDNYRSRRPIRALAALGEQAQARYYGTGRQIHTDQDDALSQTYAVTYEDPSAGGRKTFFLVLGMQRMKLTTGRARWWLRSTQDGVRPEGL